MRYEDVAWHQKNASMSQWALITMVLLGTALATPADAQTYTIDIDDTVAASGGYFQQTAFLTIDNDAFVEGFGFGVCHDSSACDIVGVIVPQVLYSFAFQNNPTFVAYVLLDQDTVNNIGQSVPNTPGAHAGILIDGNGMNYLPASTTIPAMHMNYRANSMTAGMTAVTTVCSTVGSPNLPIFIQSAGSLIEPPASSIVTSSGSVTFAPAAPQYTISGASPIVAYDVTTGACTSECTLAVDVIVSNLPPDSTVANAAGLAVSLTHDPTLLTPVSVQLGSVLANLEQAADMQNDCSVGGGGFGPDVFTTNITSSGISIYMEQTDEPSFLFPYCLRQVDWGSGTVAFTIEYDVNTSALAGNASGTTTTLNFADVGDGVGNAVLVYPTNIQRESFFFRDLQPCSGPDSVTLHPITIELLPNDPSFQRGDCNGDGAFNVADAVWLIGGYLANPTQNAEGPCAAACDVNDDTQIDVADVIFFIAYAFLNGAMPPAPFPLCDAVPGADCAATVCP